MQSKQKENNGSCVRKPFVAIICVIAVLTLCACSPLLEESQIDETNIEETNGEINMKKFFNSDVIDGETLTRRINESDMDTGKISGWSMMLSVDGQPVYKEFTGNQVFDKSSRYNLEYAENSIFQIASVSKTIVATLIFKLQEEGKLDIYEPYYKYVDDEDVFFKDVTIFHLLTHSWGYDADASSFPQETWSTPGTWADFDAYVRRLYRFDKRAYMPGSESKYSASYAILQDLVIRISGKPVEEYAQEVLLGPLGMVDTHFNNDLVDKSRYIAPNNGRNGADAVYYQVIDRPSVGNGGVFSTLDDLMIFSQMLLNYGSYNGVQVLKPETVEAMIAPAIGENVGTPDDYLGRSIGFFKRQNEQNSIFGLHHSENTFGHSGANGVGFFFDMENRVTGVFLGNYSFEIEKNDYIHIRSVFEKAYEALVD